MVRIAFGSEVKVMVKGGYEGQGQILDELKVRVVFG